MLSAYPAIFYKEENGYSVIFPDLNYLATDGETLEQALAMSVDCLAGYLYSAKLDKEEIPAPSDLKAIDPIKVAKELDTDAGEYFVNIVTVDVDEYAKSHFNKSIKKTLSIPEWLNREALDKGINFSQVLQEALVAKLRSL
jgi:predicted RNase H-like HicB family nuclease